MAGGRSVSRCRFAEMEGEMEKEVKVKGEGEGEQPVKSAKQLEKEAKKAAKLEKLRLKQDKLPACTEAKPPPQVAKHPNILCNAQFSHRPFHSE